jgi:hypothetical protein
MSTFVRYANTGERPALLFDDASWHRTLFEAAQTPG